MLPVSLSVWLNDPRADAILDLTSSKLGAESILEPASHILKALPSSGHHPKTNRESFQSQLARVLAQRIGTLCLDGESFSEIPCQELLDTLCDQSETTIKCQKGVRNLHAKCRKRSHVHCDQAKFSDNHIDCPVICPICDVKPGQKHKVFWKRFDYARHMLKHKIPSDLLSFGSSKCFCCGFGFADEKALRVHIKKQQGKADSRGKLPSIGVGAHTCDLCGKRFTNKLKLKVHVRIHDEEYPESDYMSVDQRRDLITSKYDEKHSPSPKGRQLCNQCDKDFANAANVMRHIRNAHKKVPGSKNKKYHLATGKSAYVYKLFKEGVNHSDHEDHSSLQEEAVDNPADHEETSIHLEESVDDPDESVVNELNFDCDGSCGGVLEFCSMQQ